MDRGSLPGNEVQPEEAELLPPLRIPERELAVLQGHGREHRGLRALHCVSPCTAGNGLQGAWESLCSLKRGKQGFSCLIQQVMPQKRASDKAQSTRVLYYFVCHPVEVTSSAWKSHGSQISSLWIQKIHKDPEIFSCRIIDSIQMPGWMQKYDICRSSVWNN